MSYLVAAAIVLLVALIFAGVWILDQRADRKVEAEEPEQWDWPIATTQGRKLDRD